MAIVVTYLLYDQKSYHKKNYALFQVTFTQWMANF